MSDNITLPREAVEKIHEALSSEVYPPAVSTEWYDIMDALRTALAAPRPEPVATVGTQSNDIWKSLNGKWLQMPSTGKWLQMPSAEPTKMVHLLRDLPVGTLLYAAPPAAEPTKHPGHIIGSHWLETAYSRICAGEAEAEVLKDCGWERVDEALRRDAERYKWVLGWLVRSGLLRCEACRIDTPESYGNWWILRKPSSIDGVSFVAYGADLKAAIDAAMGDKT